DLPARQTWRATKTNLVFLSQNEDGPEQGALRTNSIPAVGIPKKKALHMTQTTLTPLAAPGTISQARRTTVIDVAQPRKTRLDRSDSAPRRLHQFFEKTCDRTPAAL